MGREERFGIGKRIDELLLDLLDTLRKASYMDSATKSAALGKAIGTADSLRFFLQLAWESKLVANTQYEQLAGAVEEIERMTGGWRKGVLAKTPPNSKKDGERKE